MRWPILALVMLAGACCGGETAPDNTQFGESQGAGGEAPREPGPLRLTGLWESGEGGGSSQLCMKGKGDKAEFALIVAAGGASCAGAGEATRSSHGLTLTMAGDRACVIEARIEGSSILIPARVPESCSYYCAAGARLGGLRLARRGFTEADALKAKDPAGDPLCG